MKIVIDIQKSTYDRCKAMAEAYENNGLLFDNQMINVIAKGIVLSENHGRLVDADSLIKQYEEYCKANCVYTEKQRDFMCRACETGDAIEMLEDAPTVLDATGG